MAFVAALTSLTAVFVFWWYVLMAIARHGRDWTPYHEPLDLLVPVVLDDVPMPSGPDTTGMV